jgi:mannose-6-phosphate isomerase-like protein (cupin superfamily)
VSDEERRGEDVRPESAGGDWQVFDLEQLLEKARSDAAPYLEFLRVPSLSCGIYRLAAGARDLQGPHDEDEVYYVIEGRGKLKVEGSEREVGPGSILYVRATSRHSFFQVEEDITLLVFFASGGSG